MSWKFRAAALQALVLVLLAGCGANASSDPPRRTQIEQGREIYSQFCVSCHGDAATGQGAIDGAPPHGPTGHTWHHADGQLKEIVLGTFTYPGRTMPEFEGVLSEGEVDAVLGYIKTNWPPEQKALQEEVSRNWQASR